MYDSRQLNEKRLRLTKQYKGKFYRRDCKNYLNHGLFKVTGVIADKDTDDMRLVLKEVKKRHQFNSMFGEYSELKIQKDMYFISTTRLDNKYLQVDSKDDKFKIAESLD